MAITGAPMMFVKSKDTKKTIATMMIIRMLDKTVEVALITSNHQTLLVGPC
jgi:hypothetical protein